MKVGDLVTGVDFCASSEEPDTGIVVEVIHDVEIPPLIAVLWDNGNISKTYQDELKILCKSELDVVE